MDSTKDPNPIVGENEESQDERASLPTRPAIRKRWGHYIGDKAGPWTFFGTVLAAVVALAAGITGANLQVSGNQDTARLQFLRTQQQAAYSAFLQDEHALVFAERTYAQDSVTYTGSAAFRDGQLIQQNYGKLFGDYSNILLIGTDHATDAAGKLIAAQSKIDMEVGSGGSNVSEFVSINSDVDAAVAIEPVFVNAAHGDLTN